MFTNIYRRTQMKKTTFLLLLLVTSGQLIYAQKNISKVDSLKLEKTDTIRVNYAIADTIAVKGSTDRIKKNPQEYYIKGFRCLWELEFAHDFKRDESYFSMQFTLGHQFNPYFYLGGGTGYMEGRYVLHIPLSLQSSKFVPLFADMRISMNKKIYVPYFDLKTGYNIGIDYANDGRGFYFNPSIGIKNMQISKRKKTPAVTLSLGYSNYNHFNCFNIKLGLEF